MSLPVYFVQPAGLPQPAGKCCLCGWFAAQDGALISPPKLEAAKALVFDDRNPLPQSFLPILDDIMIAKSKIGAELVLLDFEREPNPTTLSFVKKLSAKCSVAAPETYCIGGSAEPIFCYCPAKETFDTFTRRIAQPNAWLELQPVDMEINYPLSGLMPTEDAQAFFSQTLQCHYTAKSTSNGLTLHLFDTPESLLQRAQNLAPQLKATVGLSHELQHFRIGSRI